MKKLPKAEYIRKKAEVKNKLLSKGYKIQERINVFYKERGYPTMKFNY